MIYTTLSRIRVHSPCHAGWHKLLAALGKSKAGDEPLAYSTIIEANGLDDALWCLRAEPQHEALWRMYAARCARRVQHLMTDPRSIAALDVAERHAQGMATGEELESAHAAALAAARAAACDAEAAALAAARAAARDAAWDAWDAAWAAARAAAMYAGDAAARAAATAEQTADLMALLAAYEAAPGCVGEAVL